MSCASIPGDHDREVSVLRVKASNRRSAPRRTTMPIASFRHSIFYRSFALRPIAWPVRPVGPYPPAPQSVKRQDLPRMTAVRAAEAADGRRRALVRSVNEDYAGQRGRSTRNSYFGTAG